MEFIIDLSLHIPGSFIFATATTTLSFEYVVLLLPSKVSFYQQKALYTNW